MSMTDTPTDPKPKPEPKRKQTRRKRTVPAPRVAAQPRPAGEFEGLTPTDCCDACVPAHCVISGTGYCAHPFKGGLQSAQQNQFEVVKRYRRAKSALADAKLDLRKMSGNY